MRLLNRKQRFSDDGLDDILKPLRYRLCTLAQADEFVTIMGVANETLNKYSFVCENWEQSKEEDSLIFFPGFYYLRK